MKNNEQFVVQTKDQAKEYCLIFDAVYKFGTVGLSVKQVAEYVCWLDDHEKEEIYEKFMPSIFKDINSGDYTIKEFGSIAFDPHEDSFISKINIKGLQLEEHDHLVNEFSESLKDITAEQFIWLAGENEH